MQRKRFIEPRSRRRALGHKKSSHFIAKTSRLRRSHVRECANPHVGRLLQKG
jgi:hypothetical protein